MSNRRWRFRQFLWPFQKTRTLYPKTAVDKIICMKNGLDIKMMVKSNVTTFFFKSLGLFWDLPDNQHSQSCPIPLKRGQNGSADYLVDPERPGTSLKFENNNIIFMSKSVTFFIQNIFSATTGVIATISFQVRKTFRMKVISKKSKQSRQFPFFSCIFEIRK